ncbi:MAG: hypothetical protein AAGI92_08870 [Pseudomonadota bacterium]
MRNMIVLALVAGTLTMPVSPVHSATITNNDDAQVTLVVTEDGTRRELVLAAGETATTCENGCFLAAPNGDRTVLMGGETVSIINGGTLIQP